jgi:transposase
LETVCQEHYPETELLCQVEGIGTLTALTFVLTLEDPYRFERSRSLVHGQATFRGMHRCS